MNWLQRYTYAVKAYLPGEVRNDVADELLSDLQDERAHRAECLGRDLTEEEVKALLKERGHPLMVAARFLPRTTLVSDELFPIYALLLRWMVVAIAVVQIVMVGMSALSQGEPAPWHWLPQLAWNVLNISLYGFAWLTLVFYLFGESINAADFFKNWRPESLPNLRAQGEYISRTGSAFEAVVTAYFMAWLNHVIPQSLGDNPIAFVFSDQWSSLLPWINAVLIGSIALSVTKLLFPYWTRRKVAADLALYLAAFVILAVIYQWDSPLVVRFGTEGHVKQFEVSANWIAVVILGYTIFAVVDIFSKIRKFRALDS
jgi:hypothetical protein